MKIHSLAGLIGAALIAMEDPSESSTLGLHLFQPFLGLVTRLLRPIQLGPGAPLVGQVRREALTVYEQT